MGGGASTGVLGPFFPGMERAACCPHLAFLYQEKDGKQLLKLLLGSVFSACQHRRHVCQAQCTLV